MFKIKETVKTDEWKWKEDKVSLSHIVKEKETQQNPIIYTNIVPSS